MITLASNGQVTASQFNGALNGNASSATNATNATNAGNADTTDGFHMNQNVLTTSSPAFNYVNASNSTRLGEIW